jgi:hypothetical protein
MKVLLHPVSLRRSPIAGSGDPRGRSSGDDFSLQLVAQKGDFVSGFGGGRFATFDQVVLPDGDSVVVLAILSGVSAGHKRGVWAMSDRLRSVVREGDMLDVHGVQKTVRSLGIFQVAPMVAGQNRSFDSGTGNLVYQATFTDGTCGIYTASYHPASR